MISSRPFAVIGLLALALAACSPGAPAASTATPTVAAKPVAAPTTAAQGVTAPTNAAAPAATSPAAPGQPTRGGILVIAASADPGQFNPAISTAGGTHFVADSLYNGLIFLDEKMTPKPDLADSWDISPDGKTYTFHLHPGVQWHDGQPFSSADVKFTSNLKPIGTGPYKLAEYVKGDKVRMVRNENCFKPGLPYLDELDFRIIPQASTAVLALEQGEVDYIQGVPGPDLPRVQQNPNSVLAQSGAGSGGSFCADTMFFNLSRPPLDEPEVRQAFYYGLDREQSAAKDASWPASTAHTSTIGCRSTSASSIQPPERFENEPETLVATR